MNPIETSAEKRAIKDKMARRRKDHGGTADQQRALFAEGYSLAQLRERALRRRHYDYHSGHFLLAAARRMAAYQLDCADLEWILDAPAPSASFPALKRNEMQEFGEYRTQRYVLHAYDQLARGELPDLTKSDEV